MSTKLKHFVVIKHMTRGNLSREDFAKRLGISPSYLAQLLRGERSPSPRIRQRIQTETKADFDTLFTITGEE